MTRAVSNPGAFDTQKVIRARVGRSESRVAHIKMKVVVVLVLDEEVRIPVPRLDSLVNQERDHSERGEAARVGRAAEPRSPRAAPLRQQPQRRDGDQQHAERERERGHGSAEAGCHPPAAVKEPERREVEEGEHRQREHRVVVDLPRRPRGLDEVSENRDIRALFEERFPE